MNGSNRRTIPVTCATHGGTPGYTNLVISKRGMGRLDSPVVEIGQLEVPWWPSMT